MERLTSKYNGENILLCGYCDGDQCDKEACAAECPCKCEQNAIDRLADYEDAEEQGLLIKLPPCKIGDTLYYIMDGKIYSGTLYSIFWQNLYEQGKIYTKLSSSSGYSDFGAEFEDFGKTVFLTREEAEAALKDTNVSDKEG